MPRIYAKNSKTTKNPDMITATDVGTKRALDVNIADGDVTLNTGDIEIGAVELKDASSTNRLVIDSNGNAKVSLGTAIDSDNDSITSVNQPAASIGHGIKNVSTAGTDVALASSTPCKYVIIQARFTNTSFIAVGGSGVDCTTDTGSGIKLEAGDSVTLDVDNLADVYIDSLVNGEGVRFTYGVA